MNFTIKCITKNVWENYLKEFTEEFLVELPAKYLRMRFNRINDFLEEL